MRKRSLGLFVTLFLATAVIAILSLASVQGNPTYVAAPICVRGGSVAYGCCCGRRQLVPVTKKITKALSTVTKTAVITRTASKLHSRQEAVLASLGSEDKEGHFVAALLPRHLCPVCPIGAKVLAQSSKSPKNNVVECCLPRKTVTTTVSKNVVTKTVSKTITKAPQQTINGRVYYDINNNQVYDAGIDIPIANHVIFAQVKAKVAIKRRAPSGPIGQTISNAQGAFVMSIDKQAAGTPLQITLDKLGNEPVLDLVAPAGNTIDANVPLIKPDSPVVSSAIVVESNKIQVSGTAGAGETVKIFGNGTLIGTATADANGAYIITSAALNPGAYVVTAAAVATNGAQSDPATAGTLQVLTPLTANPATVVGGNTVKVDGTAPEGSTVKLYANNVLVGTAVASNTGSFSITSSALLPGQYSLKITSTLNSVESLPVAVSPTIKVSGTTVFGGVTTNPAAATTAGAPKSTTAQAQVTTIAPSAATSAAGAATTNANPAVTTVLTTPAAQTTTKAITSTSITTATQTRTCGAPFLRDFSQGLNDANTSVVISSALTSDGGVVAVGGFSGSISLDQISLTAGGTTDGFIYKLNCQGVAVWAQGVVGSSGKSSQVQSVVVGTNGIYICGVTNSASFSVAGTAGTSDGAGDMFVAKLDSATGSGIWVKTFGNNGGARDNCSALALDSSDNVYLAGSYGPGDGVFDSTTLTATPGRYDGVVAKLEPSAGAIQWAKAYKGFHTFSNADQATAFYGIHVKADGTEITLVGAFSGENVTDGTNVVNNADMINNDWCSFDGLIAVTDGSGSPLMLQGITGTYRGDDFAFGVHRTANGNFYVTGTFSSSSIKLGDPAGKQITINNTNTDETQHSTTNIFFAKYDSNLGGPSIYPYVTANNLGFGDSGSTALTTQAGFASLAMINSDVAWVAGFTNVQSGMTQNSVPISGFDHAGQFGDFFFGYNCDAACVSPDLSMHGYMFVNRTDTNSWAQTWSVAVGGIGGTELAFGGCFSGQMTFGSQTGGPWYPLLNMAASRTGFIGKVKTHTPYDAQIVMP